MKEDLRSRSSDSTMPSSENPFHAVEDSGGRQESAGIPLIIAENLGLRTRSGYAFEDVSFTAFSGEVLAVRGRHGTGKTSLLLTVAGRMKPTEGSLEVAGFALPHQRSKVQKRVGLGVFEGLNDIPENLKVKSVIRASESLIGGRKGSSDSADRPLRSLCTEFNSSYGNYAIRDLSRYQFDQLSILLPLIQNPEVIVIDDIESELTLNQSMQLMDHLKRIAKDFRIAVAVSVIERDLADSADRQIFLSKDR